MVLRIGRPYRADKGRQFRQCRRVVEPLVHDTPLTTTHPVVAQVWRDGTRQARLARFLRSVVVLALDDGPEVGHLLARSGTTDVVDAHLVIVAVRRSEPILTAEMHDLESLTAALPERRPNLLHRRW